MHRELIGSYLLVGGGLTGGLAVGIFVVDVEPAILGWLFGAAAGLMLGAFIAAIAAGESLVGRGTLPDARTPLHGDLDVERLSIEEPDIEEPDIEESDIEERDIGDQNGQRRNGAQSEPDTGGRAPAGNGDPPPPR